MPTASIAYSWYRCDPDGTSNCAQVGTGAQYTLTAADENHAIVLQADVTSPGRTASAKSPALTVQDQGPPQATVLPAVTGTAARTAQLSGSPGTWTTGPSLSYQWQRCDASGDNCQDIAGATGLSYVLAQSDEGHTIVFGVTAANSTSSKEASSPPTSVVAPSLPVSTAAPQIRGTAQQGAQLAIIGTDWRTPDATTFASSWQRCDSSGAACQTIIGAAGTTYTPATADVGQTLVAVVTATNIDGSVRASSKPTAVIATAAPRWKALPTLSTSGAQIGDTIAITAGTWSGPPVTSQLTQMLRCTSACMPVGTQGANSYTIMGGDLGAILRVRDAATNAGGTTTVWSAQYIGPVSSISSGSAVLGADAVALRNSVGATLALASYGAPSFQTAIAGSARKPVRTVTVRRARRVPGTLKAWACPVSSLAGGPPPACSRAIMVRGNGATFKLPANATGRVRVVVVRQRH